jgi:hypothetical protein
MDIRLTGLMRGHTEVEIAACYPTVASDSRRFGVESDTARSALVLTKQLHSVLASRDLLLV